jgi:hypothetical protein
VMLRRSVRLLAIHGRPWLARLWKWASATDDDGARGPRATLGRLSRSCLALILNAEDPAGWWGLAALFESWRPSLARRCAVAAGRRATYAGEEGLHDALEAPAAGDDGPSLAPQG